MWLYTIYGFFSIVQKPGDKDLTIRARVRADLERMRTRYLPTMSDISESSMSDYRFRATTTHAAFADAVYHIAQDIDYSNFKDQVAAEQGPERARVYAGVWMANLGLRDVPDRLSEADVDSISTLSALHVSAETMMRALYYIHEYESLRIFRSKPFYAVAEKLQLAIRNGDENSMSPEDYAMHLFHDGLQKGWIRKEPTPQEWHSLLTAFVYRFLQDKATFRASEPWVERP